MLRLGLLLSPGPFHGPDYWNSVIIGPPTKAAMIAIERPPIAQSRARLRHVTDR